MSKHFSAHPEGRWIKAWEVSTVLDLAESEARHIALRAMWKQNLNANEALTPATETVLRWLERADLDPELSSRIAAELAVDAVSSALFGIDGYPEPRLYEPAANWRENELRWAADAALAAAERAIAQGFTTRGAEEAARSAGWAVPVASGGGAGALARGAVRLVLNAPPRGAPALRAGYTAERLDAMAAPRARELARFLFHRGAESEGPLWIDDGLSIHLSGPHAGSWRTDYATRAPLTGPGFVSLYALRTRLDDTATAPWFARALVGSTIIEEIVE